MAAAADVACGPHNFAAAPVLAFVVAPFVAPERLTCRERLVADRANVRFHTSSSAAAAASDGYRGRRGFLISSARLLQSVFFVWFAPVLDWFKSFFWFGFVSIFRNLHQDLKCSFELSFRKRWFSQDECNESVMKALLTKFFFKNPKIQDLQWRT